MTGWWFGCHFFYFSRNIGLLIIPIDVHIFQRGGPTTNQMIFWTGKNPLKVMTKRMHRESSPKRAGDSPGNPSWLGNIGAMQTLAGRRAGETCGYGMQITGEVILDKRSLIHRMLEKCGYLRCKSLVNKTVCELENGHRIIEIVDLPMKNGDFP